MGSSGGGNSGAVSYPAHMTTFHTRVLDASGVDVPLTSVVAAMNTAAGSNPFTSEVAYDPATPLAASDTQMGALKTLVDGLAHIADFEAIVDSAVTKLDSKILPDSYIAASSAAYNALINSQLLSTTYPRFESGMRDIGAVMTSAFTLGRSLIEAEASKDMDKFLADLRMQAQRERTNAMVGAISEMVRLLIQKLTSTHAMSAAMVEANRIKIVAMKEQTDRNVELDDLEARWPLGIYEYGNHVLASIGAGVAAHTTGKTTSTMGSVLGGAMSGASIGASTGNAYAAAAGAVIGAVAGLASS